MINLPYTIPSLAFTNLTSIQLYRITLPAFTDLRWLISNAEALCILQLGNVQWLSKASLADRRSPYRPSRGRLRTLCVDGHATWLRDPQTLQLFEWLATSGAVSSLSDAYFNRVMLLDDHMLVALASVVEASCVTLRTLALGFGPNLDVRPILKTLRVCLSLETLFFQVPYHSPAFSHLIAFAEALQVSSLKRLYLKLDWSRICWEPTVSQWSRLDTALQLPQYLDVEMIAVARIGIDEYRPVWGNVYYNQVYDPDNWRPLIKAALPRTFDRGVLAFWEDSDLATKPSLLSPNKPMPTLPIEIQETIINFVAGDVDPVETLRSCAATCRDWRPRSRRHLFRSLRIVPTSTHNNNVDKLITLLRQSPQVRQYIHSLDVVGSTERLPTLQNVFVGLGGLLPQVREISLERGSLYRHHGLHSLSHYTKSFSSVTSLTLRKVTLHSGRDLQQIVSGLQGLQTFTLSDPRWHGPSFQAFFPWTRPRMAQLQNLYIVGCSADWALDPRTVNLVRWLAHCGAVNALQSLHLEGMMILDENLLAEVQAIIRVAKDHLGVICLSIGPNIDPLLLHASISTCSALRTFGIRTPYFAECFSCLPTFVNTFSSSNLTQLLLLFVQYSDASEPTKENWTELDNALHGAIEGKHLPRLATVAVNKLRPQGQPGLQPVLGDMQTQVDLSSHSDSAWQNELVALLPRMHKRGHLASVTPEGSIDPISTGLTLSSWDLTYAPFSRVTPPAPWRHHPKYANGSSRWEGRIAMQTIILPCLKTMEDGTQVPSEVSVDIPMVVIPRDAAPPWGRRF